MTSKEFGKILQDKLTSEYGVELNVASNQQIYRSLALICRQMMSENHKKFQSKAIGTGTKHCFTQCFIACNTKYSSSSTPTTPTSDGKKVGKIVSPPSASKCTNRFITLITPIASPPGRH